MSLLYIFQDLSVLPSFLPSFLTYFLPSSLLSFFPSLPPSPPESSRLLYIHIYIQINQLSSPLLSSPSLHHRQSTIYNQHYIKNTSAPCRFISKDTGNYSTILYYTILYDTIPPIHPSIQQYKKSPTQAQA